MQIKKIAIFLLCFFVLTFLFPLFNVNANEESVKYTVHLQDIGWTSSVYDGQKAGTTGQSRRLEAIKIELIGVNGMLKYQAHVQDYGWMNWVNSGEVAGTTGQSKRLEAIIINLDNDSYNIKYRVHVQDYGWMNWVNSGEVAGTTGQSKRVEAIQIKIEKKKNIVNIIDNKSVTTTSVESQLNGNFNNNNENNYIEIINNSESSNINEQNQLINIVNNRYEDISNNLNNCSFGIDVSKHQGVIDWNKVKKAGVEFAMIRCGYRGYTEGTIYEDPQFINNIRGAYNNGIKIGIYFYSSAINEIEAIEEANFVLNLINKYGIKNYIDYPVVIDIEDFAGTRSYNLTIFERTNLVKAFCEHIKNSGLKPMVYSYTYFLETKLNMQELSNYDVWIADYYGNTWYTGKYTMWQYTDKGQIDGISVNVDLNYLYR